MHKVVRKLWWVFSRMIAPLLLLVIPVQVWQNHQDKTPPPERSTESHRIKFFDDITLFSIFILQALLEEGNKAFDHSNYLTAQKKWEEGLNLARQANNQWYIGMFIGNIGNVHGSWKLRRLPNKHLC